MYIKTLAPYAYLALVDTDPFIKHESFNGFESHDRETRDGQNHVLFNFQALIFQTICTCAGIDISASTEQWLKASDIWALIAYKAERDDAPRVVSMEDLQRNNKKAIKAIQIFGLDCAKEILSSAAHLAVFQKVWKAVLNNTLETLRKVHGIYRADMGLFQIMEPYTGGDVVTVRESRVRKTFFSADLDMLTTIRIALEDASQDYTIATEYEPGYLNYTTFSRMLSQNEQQMSRFSHVMEPCF